jgi:ketosteroid isomerase-like protein
MKSLLLFCAMALMLGSISLRSSAAQISDEEQIRAMMITFTAAFRAKDVNTIMAMYQHSDDLVAFDVAPPLRYVGWDAYKKDYEQFFALFSGPIDDRFGDLKIAVEGSMAYSYDTERIAGTLTTGHKAAMIVRATDVYRKIEGKWLIVHEHVSVPVDLTTDRAVFEAK